MADAWSIAVPAKHRIATERRAEDANVSARDPGVLYRQLAPSVLGYLRSQGAPDPEDLLGEVFVQVVRDIGRFSGDDGSLRRWLFTIAHNRLVDDRRRRARRPVLITPPPPDLPGAPDPASVPIIDPTLVAALDALTADQRDVVVLRFIADLSVNDVARILRRRPGAVRALQHRAMARLESTLAR
jgi:RNA polymerase sigma-70 factor (ECF subfamily)